MKTLKPFIFSIAFFFSLNAYATPYVTKEDATVREGAGKKYEKVGIVKKGEVLEIKAIEGNWGEFVFKGNNGFISMSVLIKEAQTVKAEPQSFSILIMQIIIGIIVIFIILKHSTFWRRIFPRYLGAPDAYKYRCKRCGEKYYYSNTSETCTDKKRHLMYKL
jgi:uncharacterized protein YgiM (DUF1202 family)